MATPTTKPKRANKNKLDSFIFLLIRFNYMDEIYKPAVLKLNKLLIETTLFISKQKQIK